MKSAQKLLEFFQSNPDLEFGTAPFIPLKATWGTEFHEASKLAFCTDFDRSNEGAYQWGQICITDVAHAMGAKDVRDYQVFPDGSAFSFVGSYRLTDDFSEEVNRINLEDDE